MWTGVKSPWTRLGCDFMNVVPSFRVSESSWCHWRSLKFSSIQNGDGEGPWLFAVIPEQAELGQDLGQIRVI